MKVILSRVDLVHLIGKIQNVISPKPALPVLANVLLEATDGQLTIMGTDLTVSMKVVAEAKVQQSGSITLPARRFFQLIREITVPEISIDATSGDIALIKAGLSLFRINGMPKSEFPPFPDLSSGLPLSVPASVLKEMLSRTSFAAAREDSRQILNGILLHQAGHLATFIGTDGKRLAKIHTDVAGSSEATHSSIVPLKAVEEMVRILDGKEELVKMTLMGDKIALEAGPVTLISKLLTGQFPDVTRVIPAKKKEKVSLHREELIALLRQVSLFTTEHSSSVRFTFTPGELHLSANSGEIGEGKVSMPVNYSGDKLEIAFNPHYFLDILRHSKDETLQFEATDSYNPALMTDSSTAEFVIMPMRLEAST